MKRFPLALLAALAAVPATATEPAFDGAQGALLPAPKFQRQAADADLFYFTPEEAEQAAQSFSAEAKAEPGFTFASNVPPDIKSQMLADLAFIQGIKGTGATPLHRKIFGSVDGNDYSRFFDSRVSAIGMDGCGSAKAVACVAPLRGPSRMWLTPNFVNFSHPQISRMMIVFHEARHTELRHLFWGHARCPQPFRNEKGEDMRSIWTGATLAGEPACDTTPFGSYGSSTIMLKNIQKFCANCTDKVKMDAGLYADDQFGRIIDDHARRQMRDDLYQ